MWRTVIAVCAVLLFLPAAGSADDEMGPPYGMMGYGMGGGMMGGMGMGGGMMGMGPYHLLDLTADQRTRINKLQDDERRKHWETLGKIMDERARLRDLYAADQRDIKEILKVQEQIDRLQRQMLELHLNTHNQIDALLTREQRDQLKSYRYRGMGMGPGPGPRGMMR